MILDAKIPGGPLEKKWEKHKFESKLINPANRRKFEIIVVGSGLAGASAAASLAEMGYQVKCFCYQDSPRRAHSIAAQGGINAAKNYQNDGDSVFRLFYDTIKRSSDFTGRAEANVYRLAEVSAAIIDQCVAQGVPFAREYGGFLANRSFGGAQVSRTFYARGQTGQGSSCSAPTPRIEPPDRRGHGEDVSAHRNARSGPGGWARQGHRRAGYGDRRDLLACRRLRAALHRRLRERLLSLDQCQGLQRHGGLSRPHGKRGAYFANPCYTQIHPTCIPQAGEYQSKLTLMSESLRNDGRVWVPKQKGDKRPSDQIPEAERDYYLERKYPSFGNLAPRDIASRSAKEACDDGRGVGPGGLGVYLDFTDAIKRLSESVVRERYGNLFDMYNQITGENAYKTPMRIYPAVHYTMGGLWVDYNLMSNTPGLFVLGEANFSDHGANRLGASALMQGLADGYFVIPYTIGNYLAPEIGKRPTTDREEFKKTEAEVRERTQRFLSIKGKRSVDHFHRELGRIMWDYCGMARTAKSLDRALKQIPPLREEFWKNVNVPGEGEALNVALEKAGRVADFLEFGELLCLDALERQESCGGHFREEYQYPDGEAKRDDEHFQHVAAWEFTGEGSKPIRHIEPLEFETVHPSVRSYK